MGRDSLLQAGMLSNRVVASWMGLADELPDAWVNGEVGIYRDEAVVVDGNLITARYPNDTTAFTQEFMRHLAKQGGLPMPAKQAKVLLVMPDLSGHFQYVSGKTLNVLGHQTQWIRSEKELNSYLNRPEDDRMSPDVVLVFPGEKGAALQQTEAWSQIPAAPIVVLSGDDYLSQLREAGTLTQKHGRTIPKPTSTVYSAVIALADGFDDRVVANMQAVLPALGYQVTTVAERSGWITGNEGLRVYAQFTHDSVQLTDDALVVAPGVTWPQHKPEARQAIVADWTEKQAERDQQRQTWLIQQYQNGKSMIIAGFDGVRLGTHEAFKGLKFSTSPQARWSFGKKGAKFSDEPVLQSSDRILTFANHQALPQLLEHLMSIKK